MKGQNKIFVRKNISLSLLIMVVVIISSISLLSTQINAATISNGSKTAGKQGVMKYLKGTWKNAHSSTESTVTFTKKYAKYYIKEIGRPAYIKKCRIISINKIKNKKGKLKGYFIKIKDGQQKIAYRLYIKDPDTLQYFFSWSKKNIGRYYSGSSSLIKSGKKDKTAYYSATSYRFSQFSGKKDFISKISYKGNKVTIKGALMKAPAFGQNSTLLKNRSRTFKMTKYCEYYYRDGLVHHFTNPWSLSTCYLRHCRVGFNRRCHRIASFSRLALTQISGT